MAPLANMGLAESPETASSANKRQAESSNTASFANTGQAESPETRYKTGIELKTASLADREQAEEVGMGES